MIHHIIKAESFKCSKSICFILVTHFAVIAVMIKIFQLNQNSKYTYFLNSILDLNPTTLNTLVEELLLQDYEKIEFGSINGIRI